MMLQDTCGYMPDDVLVKNDRAAMSTSLETRAPFLDPRVAMVAWRMSNAQRIREGKGKWIVRKLLARYVPPELTERPKTGFGIPIDEWLRGALRDWAEAALDRHGGSSRSRNSMSTSFARCGRSTWRASAIVTRSAGHFDAERVACQERRRWLRW